VWCSSSDDVKALRLSLSLDFLDEQANIDSDSETAPSVWATRKKRTIKRHKQRFHVVIRFLAGQSVTEIARRERISRWTVRRILNGRRAAVLAICEKFMRRAAREQKWREARFWQACIERLDAKDHSGKTPRDEVREWTKRLAMLRHNFLMQSAETGVVTTPDWMRRTGDTADEMAEMKRLLGVQCSAHVIQALRRRMWKAIAEVGDARSGSDREALSSKTAERGFWTAIYAPVQQVLVRRALQYHLRNQAA